MLCDAYFMDPGETPWWGGQIDNTVSSPQPEPPVGVVGQLPGLLQKWLCSADKGVALQNPGHLSVKFQVHIHKPLYVPAFASGVLHHIVSVMQKAGPATQ